MFPNPIKDKKTAVSYSLISEGEITIEIYNTIGAKVKSVIKEKQTIGKHEQAIELSTLPNGTYFIKLRSGDKTDVIKFVISE